MNIQTHRFRMGDHEIGGAVFFVVEEGQANLGDFNKALAIVDAIAQTGADAVEFQLARAADFYVREAEGYQTYLEREFTDQQIRALVAYTKSKGMEFIAASLSHKLVKVLAEAGCSGFNVNASDLTNPDIIDAVTDTGLPFFLSSPLASEEEIDWAVNRVQQRGAVHYALLHGQHAMASGEGGVHIEHTSLGYIGTLHKKHAVPVGFIDHTPFSWMPASAVAAGADIVSKHLALSRGERGPDWQICLEPDEMRQAIQWVREMEESVQIDYKKLAPGENMDKSIMRRSIVAARTLKVGDVIERGDILFKRPGTGMSPALFSTVVGKQVRRDIHPDECITIDSIAQLPGS